MRICETCKKDFEPTGKMRHVRPQKTCSVECGNRLRAITATNKGGRPWSVACEKARVLGKPYGLTHRQVQTIGTARFELATDMGRLWWSAEARAQKKGAKCV